MSSLDLSMAISVKSQTDPLPFSLNERKKPLFEREREREREREMANAFCPDCKRSTEMIFNHSTGDTVCLECGLVLEVHSINETSEWRTFANVSEDNDPVCVGGPTTHPLLTDGGLSTVISKPNGVPSLSHADRHGGAAGLIAALRDGFGRRVLCPVPTVVDLKEPPVIPNFFEDLEATGWIPVRVPAYETRWAGPGCEEGLMESKGPMDVIVFTSSAEVRRWWPEMLVGSWLEIGRRLADRRAMGLGSKIGCPFGGKANKMP